MVAAYKMVVVELAASYAYASLARDAFAHLPTVMMMLEHFDWSPMRRDWINAVSLQYSL